MNEQYRVFYATTNGSPWGYREGTFLTYKSNPERLELLKMIVLQEDKTTLKYAISLTANFFQDIGRPADSVTKYEYTREEIQDCLNENNNKSK